MNAPANTATVADLRGQQFAPREQSLQQIAPGFGSLQSFELMQRQAKLFSSSTLVPAAYRGVIEKLDRYGKVIESRENPNALANCVVALNMAQRMGADPLMVMQNLYIVEGRPSWSSQWIIAAINSCGRFSTLRFELVDLGEKTVEYVTFKWENGSRTEVKQAVKIRDKKCIAWAIEKETGARIESPSVSIEMAVKEGWYTKNGSKWQTMDEVMLPYRTASFFGKLHSPELLMGLQSVEEAQDIITLDAQPDGTYAPAEPQSVESLRASSVKEKPATEPLTIDVTEAHAEAPEKPEPDEWIPTAEEAAAIRAREQAEAGEQATATPTRARNRGASIE